MLRLASSFRNLLLPIQVRVSLIHVNNVSWLRKMMKKKTTTLSGSNARNHLSSRVPRRYPISNIDSRENPQQWLEDIKLWANYSVVVVSLCMIDRLSELKSPSQDVHSLHILLADKDFSPEFLGFSNLANERRVQFCCDCCTLATPKDRMDRESERGCLLLTLV